MRMQVVKKGKVQLQNRLVPDAPVQDWTRKIEDLQPDIDRVLQVRAAAIGPSLYAVASMATAEASC